MHRFRITPMTAINVGEVARLEQECFPDPWSLNSLESELQNPHGVFWVAEWEGVVAGYAGLHHILDEGHVTNVAVSPAFRRQGVARALMEALLRYGEAHQLAFVTLEVRPSNRAAVELYHSLGFWEAGRRRNYYRHPLEDALLLTWTPE